ncbi:6-bladed beta-propeller [Parabacteroides sp. OttesenSCG-928-J18]|nr:6-bladed beta-propeller [Parabacteroides sp. OttesenSCG-928-J18]
MSPTHKFLFFLLLLTSCTQKQQEELALPQIQVNQALETDFNTLIEDIVCIPLESAKNAHFNGCWKLEEYKDKYYIYSFHDVSVSIFSNEGVFIKQIKGDHFEDRPSDIYINEEDDQLWLLKDRKYIAKYTLEGELLSREELPFIAVDMTNAGNGEYLFFDGNMDRNAPGYIRLSNGQDTVEDPFFIMKNTTIRQNGYFPFSLFTENEDRSQIYAMVHYRDTIYSFDTKGDRQMKPFLRLDFDGQMITDSFFPPEGFSDKAFADLIEKYIHSINGFHYAAGKFFFRTLGPDQAFYILDPDSHQLMRSATLFDGLATNPYDSPCAGKGDYLYVVLPAEQLCVHYENRQSAFPPINELIKSLTPSDNNVILKIKIRKI